MARLSMGEAEALLGLPASTLRHWERALSVLGPRKDDFGRRVYSEAEIRLLFRVKYLSQRRALGLRETEERILEESASPLVDERSRLAEIRGELISLWLSSRETRQRLAAHRGERREAASARAGGPEAVRPDRREE
jgi:DNA-binding transcriptional MerR regulator